MSDIASSIDIPTSCIFAVAYSLVVS